MTDRISLLIKAKNLSAAQFADEIGVQRSGISHLMSGRNKPSLDLIQKTLQRFPDVSTEWLLFGKGEMMRELNLFDSQSRSGRTVSSEKLELVTDTMLPSREIGTLFNTRSIQGTNPNMETTTGNETNTSLNPAKESKAMPFPNLAAIAKNIEERKESDEEPSLVINKKSSKKERAIDQIIVLYDDRTFIIYSPGN